MLYRVYLNEASAYGDDFEHALINPSLTLELNSAGSFDFTIPKSNIWYEMPQLYTTRVEVYEKEELIFIGRVVSIDIDFLLRKKCHCEGLLAVLNDTIQRPQKFSQTSIRTFFSEVIKNHNSYSSKWPIGVGEITIEDRNVDRELNYDSTFDVIQKSCINTDGGYLFFRKGNPQAGETLSYYVDWKRLEDFDYNSQEVFLSINLLDLTKNYDIDEFKTAVIPLGPEDDNGVKMTIRDANNGLDYLWHDELVNAYGTIYTTVDFDSVTTPAELKVKGQEWLTKQQFNDLTIEVDAADLSVINNNEQMFKIGQKIFVKSDPHVISNYYPLVKMSLNLDTGVKKITVGTLKKQEISKL